jgi:site-specific DNA-methyltransferase (adenine-specific)
MELKKVDINSLKEWDKNPRSIKQVDFERLKAQIVKLGQYKPLIVTLENEVIGGNMRLKAFKDLGIKEVWVTIVEPKSEQEKLEIALSDNDRAGYYDDDMLANLIGEFPKLDLSQFAVDMNVPIDLKTLFIGGTQGNDEQEVDESLETKNECPSCHYKW